MSAGVSIRDRAFEVTNSVKEALGRQSLSQLLQDFRRVPEGGAEVDRSYFGYLANQIGRQFIGYLLIDSQRDTLKEGDLEELPIPTIADEERTSLEAAHIALRELDRLCSRPLLERTPLFARHVDPYSHLAYQESATPANEELWDKEKVRSLITAFHTHPGFDVVTSALQELQVKRDDANLFDQWLRGVLWWDETLKASGPMSAPNEVRQVLDAEKKGSRQRLTLKLFTGLVSLRNSLENVNQLIYQAVLDTRLPALTNDNVIDFTSNGNYVGEGISITFQPDEKAWVFNNGYICLVRLSPTPDVKEFCRSESIRFHFSKDMGTRADAMLRVLDSNLNPYFRLLMHI